MASISGTSGADALVGTPEDDTLSGNGGRDTLDGGAGFDTADFSAAAGDLDADLAAGAERLLTNATLLGIEAALGGAGDDVVAGDDGANLLDGRGGDDRVDGRGGDDTLLGGRGDNSLDGGAGFDTADYGWAGPGDAAFVDLAGGSARVGPAGAALARDVLERLEGAAGGAGADTLLGSAGANRLDGRGGGDSLAGAAGDDTISGADGADTIAGGQGNDTLAGGAGDDALAGGTGTDTAAFAGRRADFRVSYVTDGSAADGFVVADARPGGAEGTDTVAGVEFFRFADGAVPSAELVDGPPLPDPGADPIPTIFGTPIDDRLWFQPGDEIIDGLDGGDDWLDVLAEGRRGSAVTARPDGAVEVAHAGQTDAVLNVEEMRFADGRLVFDAGDAAAQVARLYEAALDRQPDQGGLNFWIDALQAGTPLSALASGFLASGEFAARFGALPDDGAFVDRMYLNVLGRQAEPAGKQAWLDFMGRGGSRADVLTGFSESAENKSNTAGLVREGIWDRSETAAEVARLYDTVLGRAPDAGGLSAWAAAIDGGAMTLRQAADGFVDSAEFQQRYAALGDRAFVAELYRNSLDREPDAAGLEGWLGLVGRGAARSDVVLGFSESPEHVALTAPVIQSDNPAEFGILFV